MENQVEMQTERTLGWEGVIQAAVSRIVEAPTPLMRASRVVTLRTLLEAFWDDTLREEWRALDGGGFVERFYNNEHSMTWTLADEAWSIVNRFLDRIGYGIAIVAPSPIQKAASLARAFVQNQYLGDGMMEPPTDEELGLVMAGMNGEVVVHE